MDVDDVKFFRSHSIIKNMNINIELEAGWVLRVGLDDFGEDKDLLPLLGSKPLTMQFILLSLY